MCNACTFKHASHTHIHNHHCTTAHISERPYCLRDPLRHTHYFTLELHICFNTRVVTVLLFFSSVNTGCDPLEHWSSRKRQRSEIQLNQILLIIPLFWQWESTRLFDSNHQWSCIIFECHAHLILRVPYRESPFYRHTLLHLEISFCNVIATESNNK